jgi:hypothetical protein
VAEAEELYLDEHLGEVVRLVESDLPEEEFRRLRSTGRERSSDR